MTRMHAQQVVVGVEVPAVEPTPAASLGEALGRAAGRPVLVEALLGGVPVQAHRDGDQVTLFGDVPDPDAVRAAVLSLEASSAVVDAVADADGVRFTDLLLLDGRSWVGRPAGERLAELAEVAPVAHMVERTAPMVPAWAEAFVEHLRARGGRGVSVRLADAPRGAPGAWQVVEF